MQSPHPNPLPQAGEGTSQSRPPTALAGETAPYPLSRARERAGVRVARARQLRTQPTKAEALLWQQLRGRRFDSFKFRRQRPIGPYFADFVCMECHLVVELDGGQHVDDAAYDAQRTAFMRQAGFYVVRFWNHDVLQETEAVLTSILQTLQTLTPTLSRARERE
jgi:very-short-patch-repair endonuclease